MNDLFSGIMRAQVIKVIDEKENDRIAVFIPKIMGLISTEVEYESEERPENLKGSIKEDAETSHSTAIKITNFAWARPASMISGSGGSKFTPEKDTWIYVFFEDNDPKKLYYLPFAPTIDTQELEEAFGSNATDPEKRPQIITLAKTPNGNLIGFDYNDDTNVFLIRMASGQLIEIKDTETERYTKMTDNERSFLIDSINKTIAMESVDNALEIKDEIPLSQAPSVTVRTTNKLIIDTPSAPLFQPNILPNCLVTGAPHCLSTGGATDSEGTPLITGEI